MKMNVMRTLAAAGLVRTISGRGFCPACRRPETATADGAGAGAGAQIESAAPVVVALAVLVVAAFAWVLTFFQWRWMAGMNMGMSAGMSTGLDLGSAKAFGAGWLVMMTAMMLPSATPLIFDFARKAEGRRGWRTATGLLGVSYISIWLAFGFACYAIYSAIGMPWSHQGLVGVLAIVLAGVYALTPFKRASEARCRERCALHGPLPFNLLRSALVAGARYSISCVGCSAALMVAMVIVGMAHLGWMVILAAFVLVYKLAPAPSMGGRLLLSASLAVVGVAYAMLA